VRRKGLARECWSRLLSVEARRVILPAILAHSRTFLGSIIARRGFLIACRPLLHSMPSRRVPTAKRQKLVVNMFVDGAVGRTMPNRLSTEAVSMVCSAGTSTRNNECSGRNGILACIRSVCASSASDGGGVVVNYEQRGGKTVCGRVCAGSACRQADGRQVLCTFGCVDRLFRSVTGRGPREPGKRIHAASAENVKLCRGRPAGAGEDVVERARRA